MNHKRVQLIWRQEGLKVRSKQPKRSRLWLNDGSCVRLRPTHRNHVWSYDFVMDRTRDGRAIKIMTVVDDLITFFNGRLSRITSKMVEEYKTKRTGSVKPATVNREFSRLRHMMGMAVRWGDIRKNPCEGIKELREPPGRVRYLEPDEYHRLLGACTVESLTGAKSYDKRKFSALLVKYLRPIVELAANTGLRRGEILGLERKDIDFKRRLIAVEETKNGERRVIPMNDTVHRLLSELPPRLDSPLLFVDVDGNSLTMAFRRAVRRAGIRDFRFHDLRHCFASHLTMQGTNLRAIMDLMGHKDMRMTIRYSHLSPGHLQQAVNGLDRALNRSTNRGAAKDETQSE